MSTSAPAADDVVLAGYFELKLTGLETLKFTNVSGLTHTVNVSGGPVGSTTGAAQDGRVVGPPDPVRLTMQYVVQTTMDLWTWLDQTITSRADPTAKKTGTLELMPMGGPQTPLKTWNLDSVYLTSVSLDSMGASASAYLTASISLLVGSCIPM
jgi:phage tail-like protein